MKWIELGLYALAVVLAGASVAASFKASMGFNEAPAARKRDTARTLLLWAIFLMSAGIALRSIR